MPKLPTANDVKNARKQAAAALEQARTPLYAVLGAGDLASEAIRDYVTKARGDAAGQAKDVQVRVAELQTRLAELQDRLGEVRTQVRTQVRTRVDELPKDVAALRGRLEPAELRHALENYAQSLQDLYDRLASRGEATATKLRERPQVKKAIDRAEGVADTTEDRVGKLVEDARELTYEVLGRVSRRTRSTGEKTANRVEKAADELSDAIDEAGDEAAHTTRSVSRKAANRTAPPKATTASKATTSKATASKATASKATTSSASASKASTPTNATTAKTTTGKTTTTRKSGGTA